MLPTDYCSMTFYYHMFGGDCGSLLVYLYTGPGQTAMLFNKTGDQGNKWFVGSVTIKSQYGFRVHIVATKGSSYKGDIAVDDISFSGNCKFTSETAMQYGEKALTTGRDALDGINYSSPSRTKERMDLNVRLNE